MKRAPKIGTVAEILEAARTAIDPEYLEALVEAMGRGEVLSPREMALRAIKAHGRLAGEYTEADVIEIATQAVEADRARRPSG